MIYQCLKTFSLSMRQMFPVFVKNYHFNSKSAGKNSLKTILNYGTPILPSQQPSVCKTISIKCFGSNNNSGPEFDIDGEELKGNEEYQHLVSRYMHVSDMGQQVFVIQPYVKWGSTKKTNTTPQLQLAEAVSLIGTLKKWQVVQSTLVPVERLDKKFLFGSGNFEKLKDVVKRDKNITCVFISINILKGVQRRQMEKYFQVPVYDRYSIVVQILKEHAVTKEAKLQVALAEVPYLWARLHGSQEQSNNLEASKGKGLGESPVEVVKQVLTSREVKLKHYLKKLQEQRKLSRKKRDKMNIPIVAVVGYTNAGKTSLIKALTGEKSLQPKNTLFATLDVTAHEGMLPCNLKVLYIDTVGFMSDIPTKLIECFKATLEDVILADVILHVCDLSHPDAKAQAENVLETLRTLGVPDSLMDNMITIGNKVDNETLFSLEELGLVPIKVSALNSTGIADLEESIQRSVLKATGRQYMVIRVPSGGEEARWLYKEGAVTNVTADTSNNQYLLIEVVLTKLQIVQFKNIFL